MSIIHIPIQLIFSWEHLKDPCGVKDLQSRFVYANSAYIELLNLPKSFNIIGKSDSDIPASTAEFADLFYLHDRLVESEMLRITSLEVHKFGRSRSLSAYFFDKTPFFDSSGSVVGTFFFGRLAEHLPIEVIPFDGKREISVTLVPPSSELDTREWEVVFLICKGASP